MKLLKSVKDHILFHILAVVVITAACVYLILIDSILWASMSVMALIICIRHTVRLYNCQIKKVIFLLDALENNDNAIHFSEQMGSKNNRAINQLLNRVAHILHEAKTETIQQEKYYELVLNCISTGILVINDQGAVFQKNRELLKLLGVDILTHIRQLDKIDPKLTEKLKNARSGDHLHLLLKNLTNQTNLLIRVSDITIRKEHLRIFAFSDINNELDEKEVESWIRLTRVLTHEIMNSITPITSLSDTLLSVAGVKNEELYKGLQTISFTGKGLLSFVHSYRQFTNTPTPEPTLFYVKPFIDRMVELAKHQTLCEHIVFDVQIQPSELILYADENLIGQVVINLLKNAIQAIGDRINREVNIIAYSNEEEEILIEISNNGEPIPDEIKEQLFIPFFTTKQGGSGIGLSLSRQIMQLSKGSITLKPDQTTMTTFSLCFK